MNYKNGLNKRHALKTIPIVVSLILSSTASAEDLEVKSKKETEQTFELQEISVTGTKRSQLLQDAVQSVTVFEERDTIGMQYGLDVFRYVPNISFQSGSLLPTIRGLDGNGIATGGGGAVSGAQPRMSVYIDGVARTYGATPDGQGSFWDIDQIEVYKGSQSTQLGRNSISGAIVQTTKDPKFKDEYAVQAGFHDQKATYNAAFMANKKISDQVAIRLTGETIDGKGFADYSDLNVTGLSTSDKKDFGDNKFTRFRFKALVAPTEIPDLLVKLTLDSERSANPYPKDMVDSSEGSNRKLIGTGDSGYYRSFNKVAAVSVSYALNNEWSLDSILSYQRASTNFGPPLKGNPDVSKALDFTFNVDETAFEPKISYLSSKTRTNAVLGAFYLTRSRTDLGKPGSAFALNADDKSSTKSLYADAAIELNNQWDLLLGGRLERSQQQRVFSAFAGALALDFDKKNEVFLPKIGATYHITPDASVSLVTYKGYTASGGGLSFVTFTPYDYDKESAQTTEISTRTQWLNNKLTANANVFYTRLKDTQVNAIGPAGPTDSIYINLDKAKTYGSEFSLTYQPTSKDRATFSLGLLQTEIDKFGDAANDVNNGNDLALSPSVTASIGGYSEVYPNLTLGVNASYSGKRYSDYQNRKANELDSYVITNINAQYVYKNTTFTGYVNNVFNEYAVFNNFSASNQAYVNAPRTVGVNVKMDF